ncbi:MAG: MFS transporter, partial [Candidatus Thermoplasmatota archaeon]|nr:MFS transporter [Candidatus Thermoplasmatota archaeon]
MPQRRFEKINPFVSSLSVLSFLFALTMNIFGYTIFYFLETNHIPIIYGGIGTTVGQIVLLFIVIPQGRLIDKGKSYTLMIAGALIYSVSIILFFVDTNFVLPMAALLATSLIAIMSYELNTFKSSLSAFIGKAVKSNVIGKHYSRIVMMETAGGTVAMFAVAATILFSDIGMIYLIPGIILFTATILSLFFLFPEQRKHIRNEENKTHRPGFIESVRTFRDRKRFIASAKRKLR